MATVTKRVKAIKEVSVTEKVKVVASEDAVKIVGKAITAVDESSAILQRISLLFNFSRLTATSVASYISSAQLVQTA